MSQPISWGKHRVSAAEPITVLNFGSDPSYLESDFLIQSLLLWLAEKPCHCPAPELPLLCSYRHRGQPEENGAWHARCPQASFGLWFPGTAPQGDSPGTQGAHTPGLPGFVLSPAAPACSSCARAQLEALLSRGDTATIQKHKENDEGAEGWDLGGRLNELNLSSFADQSCRQEPDNCLGVPEGCKHSGRKKLLRGLQGVGWEEECQSC